MDIVWNTSMETLCKDTCLEVWKSYLELWFGIVWKYLFKLG